MLGAPGFRLGRIRELLYALSMNAKETMQQLFERARSGDLEAIEQLLAAIETNPQARRELVPLVSPLTGKAHRVALLGVKRSGKSTLIVSLARRLSAEGRRVGVVAVEPAPAPGEGARLGDRLRIDDLHLEEGVVVRSVAAESGSRAHSLSTTLVADVLDALGQDPILLEIPGVDAPHVRELRRAHTLILLLTPGGPDPETLRAAGLLEMADIIVVNKADRDGADELVAGLRKEVGPSRVGGQEWDVPILKTTAYRDEGIDELAGVMSQHCDLLRAGVGFEERRQQSVVLQLEQLVEQDLLQRLREDPAIVSLFEQAAQEVTSHGTDLLSAAKRIADRLGDAG